MTILSADNFKRATAVAVKAIGHKAELEVGFSNAPSPDSETRISMPEPPAVLTQAALDIARGAADAAALRLRYHNEKWHEAKAPSGGEARANFDRLEQARYEALGALEMKGVA
ncbi:MAG: cobaltochelatase subunit CobT, partial [Alphaproteobacteria bacterium]